MPVRATDAPFPGEQAPAATLAGLIDRFAARRVLVVGDFLADEFIYGRIERVSREAPVLILKYDSTEVVAGGAGNAANNVAALGGRARAFGLAGRDEPGRRMVASLHTRVDRSGLLRLAGWRTPTKTRILAGGIHSAKQQVVRIDREPPGPPDEASQRSLQARLESAIDGCDAVLVSDYGFGLATPALVAHLAALVSRRSSSSSPRVPILVDSRYDLIKYHGATACTPNESEVEHTLGIEIDDNGKVLETAGRSLLKRTRMEAVLITRGSRGMALFEPKRPTLHIPIFGSDEIADVTGAGDTVIATLTLALASGASFAEAAHLANYAGGLVVMKRGTATITADELRAAIAVDERRAQKPRN